MMKPVENDKFTKGIVPPPAILFMGMAAIIAFVFLLLLSLGSVHIPLKSVFSILTGKGSEMLVWERIVLNLRLPKTITAVLAGMALSISGLQMQTLFRNPLAGPFVLGISSGASLGVAIFVLAANLVGSAMSLGFEFLGEFGIVIAATLGASSVLILILAVSFRIRNTLTLLIVGIMFGYATGGIVNILLYFSNPHNIQSYIVWTFGSFRGVTWNQAGILIPIVAVGMCLAITTVKSLNAMLLGDAYARSLGLNVKRVRVVTVFSTALLAGSVTAFCGPIGFLGIAVPHLCRGLFSTSDHRTLVPAVAGMGAVIALCSELIAQLPGSQYSLPLNAITALFGAPVVIWVVLRQRSSMVS
ncbi:MAG: iron ABC transporter permease [Proteobacteria bacterium]|nr:iron ABC transporter permease [Pseudomonadota bacterium]